MDRKDAFAALRELIMDVTDQQLAEMADYEREYILANRAAIRAFERGDVEELKRLALEQLAKLQRSADEERAERELIWKLAERAVVLELVTVTRHGVALIMCAHRHCPLRLADLLTTEDHNFAHDIGGLMRHMNPDTGDMGGFLPKFHQRKSK